MLLKHRATRSESVHWREAKPLTPTCHRVQSSRRQTTVATSSTNSEYIGQANVIKQACHLIQFLGEVYRFPNLPLKIYAETRALKRLPTIPNSTRRPST